MDAQIYLGKERERKRGKRQKECKEEEGSEREREREREREKRRRTVEKIMFLSGRLRKNWILLSRFFFLRSELSGLFFKLSERVVDSLFFDLIKKWIRYNDQDNDKLADSEARKMQQSRDLPLHVTVTYIHTYKQPNNTSVYRSMQQAQSHPFQQQIPSNCCKFTIQSHCRTAFWTLIEILRERERERERERVVVVVGHLKRGACSERHHPPSSNRFAAQICASPCF